MKNLLLIVLILVQSTSSAQVREPVVDELIPIVRIAPQFPRKAFMSSISGWVKVKMMVNARGSVDDAVVVDARPRHVFDREATRAALKFKFKPRIVDGVPVKAEATQTFEFEYPYPDQVSHDDKSKLINLMQEPIELMQPVYSQVILADSVRIKSRIKAKKVTAIDFMYTDDLLSFDSQPLFWQHQEVDKQNIDAFADKLAERTTFVMNQYQQHPGIFNRFHTIYQAQNHPPELLSKVNYQPLNEYTVYSQERFKMTIDQQGRVTEWKSLSDKKWNNEPRLNERMDDFLSGLIFLPAVKKGQPVEDKITIEFTTVNVSFFDVINESLVQNKQHVSDSNWVKLRMLRGEDGRLLDIGSLASSDDQFANQVMNEFTTTSSEHGEKRSQHQTVIIRE